MFWPAGASAQTTNATIIGDVRDSSDAAVVGATVTVKNAATGISRSVQTDSGGSYRVYPLNPGTYDVSVSLSGFKTQVHSGLSLDLAANLKVDFKLEVGQITETVQVAASAPVLQTQDASVGGLVTGTEVSRLPVNGRNYTRLVLLLPGTSDQGSSQSRGTFSGTQLVAINGQRRQDNNYTVDGADNNFLMMNSPGMSPPMDSIEEFRVMNNSSAEFGRSSGANINLSTKAGTRDLHASVYEYFRNDKINANDFFANRQGIGVVPFKQNQYGISAGGPVYLPKTYNGREKTFWFINWEGLRRRRGSTLISSVPTADERAGNFSAWPKTIYNPFTGTLNPNGTINRDPFPNNIIPASLVNPASALFLKLAVPLPNRAGLANNLINTNKAIDNRDSYVMRFDHSFNSSNSLFVRWGDQKVQNNTPNVNPVLQPFQRFDAYNLAAAYTHLFGPTSVLEVKFGFNNPRLPNGIVDPAIPNRAAFLQQAGIPLLTPTLIGEPIPAFNATGEFSLTGGGQIGTDEDTSYQESVAYTRVMGPHSLKAGFNYTRRLYHPAGAGPGQGTFDFDTRLTSLSSNPNSGSSAASMILGTMSDIRRGVGLFSGQGRQNVYQAYVQDDWRASSKLTVNLGVRYELAPPMYDAKGRLGSIWIKPNFQTNVWAAENIWAGVNPLTNAGPNQEGFGPGLQKTEYTDFAPRVGIAYQLDSKTVIRSGFGFFYNSSFVQEFQDRLKLPPYILQEVFTTNTGTTPDLTLTTAGPPVGNNIGGWPQDPYKRTPYSEQWNLTVQRQLMQDLSLEVAYVGNSNHHQIGYTQINQALYPSPAPIQPRRPLPGYGDMDAGYNIFNSNYESLRVNLVKRFSKGLQLDTNYTWGKSLTDQSSLAEENTQNEYDRRPDWGVSSMDLRHIFQAAYVYELPFGRGRKFGDSWSSGLNAILGDWTINGIARIQTGAPLNVVLNSDYANVGKTGGSNPTGGRPNLIGDPNTGHSRNVDVPFFNTSAFVLPAPYSFGNAGQNVTRADGRQVVDFSVAKDFRFRERHSVQFRAEIFNLPNHVNFGQNQNDFGNSGTGYNTTFGSSTFGKVTAATPARQIQFVLRYSF